MATPELPAHLRHNENRTPIEDLDLENIAKWKLVTFNLQEAWDFAKHGFAATVENVRLSDETVFALPIFMPPSLRARYFGWDFDSRGDIRPYRKAMDPPMVIQCHGLNWFPVYRETNILCGSWSKACCSIRGTIVTPYYGYQIGEFVAPPEAAKTCSAPLQLDYHHLLPSPSGVSPDNLLLGHCPPTSLNDAIARQGIHITMDFSKPIIIVVDSKQTAGAQMLTEIEGFHYLAGPKSDPMNPYQCIRRHFSSKEDLSKKYGGPYKNATTMKPLKNPTNWGVKLKQIRHAG